MPRRGGRLASPRLLHSCLRGSCLTPQGPKRSSPWRRCQRGLILPTPRLSPLAGARHAPAASPRSVASQDTGGAGSRRDGIFQPAQPIFLYRPSSACGALGRGPWGRGWGVNRSCPTAANKTRPSHAPSIFCDHTRMHSPRCASLATASPGAHAGWAFPLLPFRSSLVMDVTLSFPHVQPVPPLSGPTPPPKHTCGAERPGTEPCWHHEGLDPARRARPGTACPAPLTQLLSVHGASCPPLPLPCLAPCTLAGAPIGVQPQIPRPSLHICRQHPAGPPRPPPGRSASIPGGLYEKQATFH